MNTTPTSTVAALALLCVSASAHAQVQTTSPGTKSVFSKQAASMSNGGSQSDIQLLGGEIVKAKKKHVLRIDATLSTEADVRPDEVYFVIGVNNTDIGTAVAHCDSTEMIHECGVSGSFWVDLDAAEQINPGTVIGRPLTIVMRGGSTDLGGVGELYAASFSAQMVKK